MDSKDLAIGILSTTAVILLVGLIVVHSRPEPAYGFGMTAQGGDYILTTGQLQSAQELLYVIDGASEKLLVYRFDVSRKQIQIAGGETLDQLREAASDSDPAQPQQRGRRGRRSR